MENKYSQQTQLVLDNAQEQAKRFNHSTVGVMHLLIALTTSRSTQAGQLLNDFGINTDVVLQEVEKNEGYGFAPANASQMYLPYSPKAKEVLDLSMRIALNNGATEINNVHLLLALIDDETTISSRVLVNLGVNLISIRQEIAGRFRVRIQNGDRKNRNENINPNDMNRPDKKQEKLMTVDQFSRDLTQLARDGQIETAISRESEINRMVQILSRKTKNNPVLVGEPGVGKTAIVEGLAKMIAEDTVAGPLKDKRILSLDLTSMIAGTKFRGEFEERMKNVIEEVRNDNSIILFIDELHTIIGAGSAEGATDAGNILKPALSRGEFQTIGATTFDEYQKYIQKDAALERRFASITVDEPTSDQAKEILRGLRPSYEKFHKVNISDKAIDAAVDLSVRYITDRFLPDKAIDLIDEAAAMVRIDRLDETDPLKDLIIEKNQIASQIETAVLSGDVIAAKELKYRQNDLEEEILNTEIIEKETPIVEVIDIEKVLSETTGIPMNQLENDESEKLLNLESELDERVVGQSNAVSAVARAIRRARSGIKDPKRPIGTFLFLGTTGVGKTELAKALAENMFGNEENMIRLDMSEFQEKVSVSRLIGAQPGYIGYEEGGQLTEKVRRHPYSVILLDEVEKANSDVYGLLLQVFDDGFLTDSRGRKIDFRNTIIIMTSNLGATRLFDNKTLGFGQSGNEFEFENIQSGIKEALKEYFRPEFLNRIDETVVFKPLNKEEIRAIVKLMSKSILQRLSEQGIASSIDVKALDKVGAAGFDPEFGARPIRRAFQNLIEDKLSDLLLAGELVAGDKIKITVTDNELDFQIKKPSLKNK